MRITRGPRVALAMAATVSRKTAALAKVLGRTGEMLAKPAHIADIADGALTPKGTGCSLPPD